MVTITVTKGVVIKHVIVLVIMRSILDLYRNGMTLEKCASCILNQVCLDDPVRD